MANVALHREKIVQATVRLYREQGYANTGLNEILKLSGAPKGSLYHYFPGGKEELTVEAISVAGRVVEKTLIELANKTDSPQAFIREYSELLAGWMEGSRFKSGCPIATTVLETVPDSKAITEICQTVFANWIKLIASAFETFGLKKEEAYTQAELVISAVEGALILVRVKKSAQPLFNLNRLFKG